MSVSLSGCVFHLEPPSDVFNMSHYAAHRTCVPVVCHSHPGFAFTCANKVLLGGDHGFNSGCVSVRLVSLVIRLREWAHRSLLEEEERPDSFMERFRGPELRMAPSRSSNTHPDATGNNATGIFRYVCLLNPGHALAINAFCAILVIILPVQRC